MVTTECEHEIHSCPLVALLWEVSLALSRGCCQADFWGSGMPIFHVCRFEIFVPSRCCLSLFHVTRGLQTPLSPSAPFFPERGQVVLWSTWSLSTSFWATLPPLHGLPAIQTKKTPYQKSLYFKILEWKFCSLLDSTPSVRSSVYN